MNLFFKRYMARNDLPRGTLGEPAAPPDCPEAVLQARRSTNSSGSYGSCSSSVQYTILSPSNHFYLSLVVDLALPCIMRGVSVRNFVFRGH